jgi:hypothetical protein
MATPNVKTQCSICDEERNTFLCRGCSKDFCFDHLTEHRQLINIQLHHIQNDYNEFKQIIIDRKNNPEQHPLIKQIKQWENESIHKIKQKAKECREILINYTNEIINRIENKLENPNEQLISNEKKNNFNEIDLDQFKEKLEELKEELNQPTYISIAQKTNSFINEIFIKFGKFEKIQSRIIKKNIFLKFSICFSIEKFNENSISMINISSINQSKTSLENKFFNLYFSFSYSIILKNRQQRSFSFSFKYSIKILFFF